MIVNAGRVTTTLPPHYTSVIHRPASPMRLLLVEDDRPIADFVQQGLREAGYQVEHAADGDAGFHAALRAATDDGTLFDAAIVDLMLPRRDGLAVIEGWRARGVAMPVLILSARRTVDDRVRGLQAGGDDYLVKPFAFAELLARVQALLRRAHAEADPTRLVAGPLVLDRLAREVTRAGTPLDLQPREFALLEHLMRHAGRVVTRTAIQQHVWDVDFDPQTNVVEVLVHRLRQKVDAGFEPRLIQTVRGVGYALRVA